MFKKSVKYFSSFKNILQLYSQEFDASRQIEKIIPRQFTQLRLTNLTNNLHYTHNKNHLSSLNLGISEPIWDLLDRGGKRWRPILCMLIAQIFNRGRSQIFDIASFCQIVHNGTLMVDDIEDKSKIRRNKQCIHLIYGDDVSINAGNLMYFAPFLKMLQSDKYTSNQKLQMSTIYAQQMTNLHIGQAWDIVWHNHQRLKGEYPTQKHYLQMTAHKTGVLARLSCRLVCVYLNLNDQITTNICRLAQSMGVAFQIQDDLLNLEGEQYKKTKGYSGEDIHEGKMTIMVIHAIAHAQKRKAQRLLTILRMKTQRKQQIEQAIGIMRESKSLEYARTLMQSILNKAWKGADSTLPENASKGYLRQLAFFNIDRKL